MCIPDAVFGTLIIGNAFFGHFSFLVNHFLTFAWSVIITDKDIAFFLWNGNRPAFLLILQKLGACCIQIPALFV